MASQMMNSNSGGKSNKDRMKLLTTVSFTPINSSSAATSSSQSYDLSSYDVNGKTADDFFIRITKFSAQPTFDKKEGRTFNSLTISGFSNSKLTLTGSYDPYDYHAINFGISVEIYMFT